MASRRTAACTPRALVRCGAVTIALAIATWTLPAALAQAVTSAQIVAMIDSERQANGLPLVREDPALSAGCAQYDNYRRLNGSLQDAFTLGAEDPTMPGYSAAGSQAGRDSLLNAGDHPADSFANGDVFDDAPNHLSALMDPAVAVIGADQLDFPLGIYGTVSLACVDVRSASPRPSPARLHTYAYIGPDGQAPVDPIYREGPSGGGPLFFVYVLAPKGAIVTLRSLTLRGPGGQVAQPTYLALSGGLLDGRRLAKAAFKGKGSNTDRATARFGDCPFCRARGTLEIDEGEALRKLAKLEFQARFPVIFQATQAGGG